MCWLGLEEECSDLPQNDWTAFLLSHHSSPLPVLSQHLACWTLKYQLLALFLGPSAKVAAGNWIEDGYISIIPLLGGIPGLWVSMKGQLPS